MTAITGLARIINNPLKPVWLRLGDFRMGLCLAFSVSLLLFCTPVLAKSLVMDDFYQSAHLSTYLSLYEDSQQTLTFTQAQELWQQGEFTRVTDQNLQLGYSDSAFWLHFKVTNQLPRNNYSELEDRFYLNLSYPLLDNLQFYLVRAGEVSYQEEGDTLPFFDRYFAISHFVFPFSLTDGEQADVFLRVYSTSSIPLPLKLETEQAFVDRQYSANMLDGIYVGISVGLLIYNLFLWIAIRGRAYGIYALMAFGILMFNTGISGLTYRFWPESIFFQQMNVYFFSFIAAVFIPIFGMDFLKTKESFPRFHPFLKLLVWVNLGIIPLLFWVPVTTAAKLTVIFSGTTALSLIYVAISRVVQGYRPAIYYSLGQGAVISGVIFTAVTSQKAIALYHLAPVVMKWCSAFELIFFSIGLADVVLTDRRLREKAERESAAAQKALLESQIKRNQDLDGLVQERTSELEKVNRQLRDLSVQDELTGLHNRRYLNEALSGEYRRAVRQRYPISILMIDIDHFKDLNDNFGHLFGDYCLKKAGEILMSNTRRPPDITARYGGEEFVIVLPDTSQENALFVAEKIRQQFENTRIDAMDKSTCVTVSIGVCTELPTEVDQHEQLLNRADAQLYRAKAMGRNQVVAEPECAVNL